jgi:septin family protein
MTRRASNNLSRGLKKIARRKQNRSTSMMRVGESGSGTTAVVKLRAIIV